MELREYQKNCINKIKWSLESISDGNDLCILPTGSGKSLVIASLVNEINGNILVLQPSKEILEQNYNKILNYIDKEKVGLYSASVGKKEIKEITLATIQSIYKEPENFSHFKLVIIDEAHLLNPKGEETMYKGFIENIGNPRVIGLTATPYRMDKWYKKVDGVLEAFVCTKMINRMKPAFWSRILFVVNSKELIERGYLCKLKYIDHEIIEMKDIPLNKSRSDFDIEKYSKLLSKEQKKVIEAIKYGESTSNHVLVFVSTKQQAEDLSKNFKSSSFVTSDTSKKERESILKDFKSGLIKIIFNVGVLTTGFDFPKLDCIILARPTKSIALYYQMIGRGLRISEGKEYCKIIDITGTVKTLGEVESIEVKKDENNRWEIYTSTGCWHTKELYSYSIKNNYELSLNK